MEATIETTVTKARDFNVASDRCDRCRAEAVLAAQKGKQELLFCKHHGEKHEDKLFLDGWVLIKNETPSWLTTT